MQIWHFATLLCVVSVVLEPPPVFFIHFLKKLVQTLIQKKNPPTMFPEEEVFFAFPVDQRKGNAQSFEQRILKERQRSREQQQYCSGRLGEKKVYLVHPFDPMCVCLCVCVLYLALAKRVDRTAAAKKWRARKQANKCVIFSFSEKLLLLQSRHIVSWPAGLKRPPRVYYCCCTR